jgi:hypothetical protein
MTTNEQPSLGMYLAQRIDEKTREVALTRNDAGYLVCGLRL